ncbi:MAG: ADP-ribosylation factor-like protein [Promethearchaeota archaeon]
MAHDERARKIIFTGLDNSGKSSIILALKNSIAKISQLKPTLGVERETFSFLDYTIHAHDLGGQKKYLIKYLKQPEKFFEETDVAIYVVDIQDIGRFEETISYFTDLLNEYEKLEQQPFIYVFFHKAEKVLLENDTGGERTVEMLSSRFGEINNGRFYMEFKITTIYDIWSISSSFASIMQKIYKPSELIGKAMKDLADNLEAEVAVLFDENVLMLAHYLRDERYNDLVNYTAPYFFTFKNFETRFQGQIKTDKMRLELDQYEFLFIENREHQPKLYLLLIGNRGTLPGLDEVGKIAEQIPEIFLQLGIGLDGK